MVFVTAAFTCLFFSDLEVRPLPQALRDKLARIDPGHKRTSLPPEERSMEDMEQVYCSAFGLAPCWQGEEGDTSYDEEVHRLHIFSELVGTPSYVVTITISGREPSRAEIRSLNVPPDRLYNVAVRGDAWEHFFEMTMLKRASFDISGRRLKRQLKRADIFSFPSSDEIPGRLDDIIILHGDAYVHES